VLALPEAALDSIDALCVGTAFDFSAVYSGVVSLVRHRYYHQSSVLKDK
jgi:hypothetical protein